ncbi:hypothetical protein L6R53_21050 [Myxococcota bacterium]|nr:hypothetical protein [Myxococcota bacterium]
MHQTPLFAAHSAAGATLDRFGEWMLPARFSSVEAEVAAADAGAALFDLADAGLIVLEGEEVRRWINAMFTNKYTDVAPGQGRRSVIVDDRGRVQGLVDWYCVDEQRFLGVLEGVTAAWFEERFRMFLALDDIEPLMLEGASLLSLQGPGADGVLSRLGLPCPAEDHAHLAVDGGAAEGQTLRVLRRDRLGVGGLDLLVPTAVLDATWAAAVAVGATPAGRQAQEALRVRAGRAAWPQDGTDKSMVHELHYNLDCVSFDKGCYLGQEVINRVERMGGVRKKLTRIELAAGALPEPGAEVLLGEEVVGAVTSVARVGDRAWALASLREAAWAPQTAVVVRSGDQALSATVSPA